jgi:hypothetical protein
VQVSRAFCEGRFCRLARSWKIRAGANVSIDVGAAKATVWRVQAIGGPVAAWCRSCRWARLVDHGCFGVEGRRGRVSAVPSVQSWQP